MRVLTTIIAVTLGVLWMSQLSLRTSSMRMSSFNYMPRFGVDAADLHWLRLFPAMPNAFHL
jgi:hypothetical protein